MKKLTKSKFIFLLTMVVGFTACKNNVVNIEKKDSKKENQVHEVVIGDELIYGNSFSFQDIYDEALEKFQDASRQVAARSANEDILLSFSDSDFEQMVYFSVLPTNIESVKEVNSIMGYLNPVELDKEIIQACDAEKMIFKSDVFVTDEIKPEEIVNFDVKYYYILLKEQADSIASKLEGYNVIEEFEMLTQETIQKIQTLYGDNLTLTDSDNSRGVFTNIANAIKKAVKAVVDFAVKSYEIKGEVTYDVTISKKTEESKELEEITKHFPAYGIKVSNICLGCNECNTNVSGKFSLGSRTDSGGLCSIWLNYENEACRLSNFFGLTAATLITTDWPSKLTDLKITGKTDYANAKMAVCNDLLVRYKDEITRHSFIPQAEIWTTELGSGTSSAPCFNLIGVELLPDMIITNLSVKNTDALEILHHEYTHFLHCVYANNKNLFWNNVVASEIGIEIGSIISTSLIHTFTMIENHFLSEKDEIEYINGVTCYDFENPYICFAENLADWYSLVGFYGISNVGKEEKPNMGYGNKYNEDVVYDNEYLFVELILKINKYPSDIENQKLAFKFLEIVDDYNVTTFDEFYQALIKEFPDKIADINSVFNTYYNQYGTKKGNVILYK